MREGQLHDQDYFTNTHQVFMLFKDSTVEILPFIAERIIHFLIERKCSAKYRSNYLIETACGIEVM